VRCPSIPGDNLEGTHLHVSVIELDSALNLNMRRLEEQGDEQMVIVTDKGKVVESAKDFARDIRKAFSDAVSKEGEARVAAVRKFIVEPAYKPYIYMNPIEAPWFYKEKDKDKLE